LALQAPGRQQALLFRTAAFNLIARMGRRFASHAGAAASSHRRLQPEA
jgi:hypothetical protein